MLKKVFATMMMVLFGMLMPVNALAATYNYNYYYTYNYYGCGGTSSSSSSSTGSASNQVQPSLTANEEAVKAETKRVTDAHMWEDNRRSYNGYLLQLADAFSSSAKNSGFEVKTSSWAEIHGANYTIVEQEFSKNNWTLKIQYQFGSSGFFDDCSPVWLFHNGLMISSGEDYNGWAWSSSQTIYELLDMISKLQ